MNDHRTAQTTPADAYGTFNPDQLRALQNVRESYRPEHEFFTPVELLRLRFVRWLYRAERQGA